MGLAGPPGPPGPREFTGSGSIVGPRGVPGDKGEKVSPQTATVLMVSYLSGRPGPARATRSSLC